MATKQSSEKIHFSIEVAEEDRAAERAKIEPFRADIRGRIVTMTDPRDIDWQDILQIEHPIMFLKHCVSAEDRDWLRTQKIGGAVFNSLIESYQRHYGLDKQAPGGVARQI